MAKFQATEVQKNLKGADYPQSSSQLADLARSNGAEDELVETLRNLGDNEFNGPNAVTKALSDQEDALGGPTPKGPAERETKDIEGPAWQVTEVQKALKDADCPLAGPARRPRQVQRRGGRTRHGPARRPRGQWPQRGHAGAEVPPSRPTGPRRLTRAPTGPLQ